MIDFSSEKHSSHIDFASRDGNQTHQNAFGSCDSNFVRRTIEIEQIKYFDIEIENTVLRSKKSLAFILIF